jgi:hypothetical protein
MEPGYADNAFGAQAHWSPLFKNFKNDIFKFQVPIYTHP